MEQSYTCYSYNLFVAGLGKKIYVFELVLENVNTL